MKIRFSGQRLVTSIVHWPNAIPEASLVLFIRRSHPTLLLIFLNTFSRLVPFTKPTFFFLPLFEDNSTFLRRRKIHSGCRNTIVITAIFILLTIHRLSVANISKGSITKQMYAIIMKHGCKKRFELRFRAQLYPSSIDWGLFRSIKERYNSIQEDWHLHLIPFLVLLLLHLHCILIHSSMWIFHRPTSFGYLMRHLFSLIINSECVENIFLPIVDLIHRCIAWVSE